jgi:anti-sigma factor RsiW
MSAFLKSCRERREGLCLLADSALSDSEKANLENHMATCADCRKYYDEIRSVAGPLADWENSFASVKPSEAVEVRWERDFELATKSNSPSWPSLWQRAADWCFDLIWPCRRIWAGFAVVWLAIFAVNLATRETPSTLSKTSRPSAELVRSFLESEGLVARSASDNESPTAGKPRTSSPSPRSERAVDANRS